MKGYKQAGGTTALTEAVARMALTTPPEPAPAHAATDAGSISTAPATAPAGISSPAPSITAAPSATIPPDTEIDTITWDEVQALKAEHGLQDPETVSAYEQYAAQLDKAGQHDQAIAVLQPALKEAMITLSPNHGVPIRLSVHLAHHLLETGQRQAATKHCKWLLPRVLQLDSQPASFDVTLRLAVLLGRLGLHRQELPVALHAYEIAAQSLSRADCIIGALCSYIVACSFTGSAPTPAACQHAEQLLAQCKRGQAQMTVQTANMARFLCVCYQQAGQHQQAFTLLPELVTAMQRLHGDGSPAHMEVLSMRAMNALQCGRPAQALSLLQRLLGLHKSKHGLNHRKTIECALQLGTAYRSLKRFEEAVSVFEEAWSAAKVGLSARDEITVQLFHDYGSVLTHELGRIREARALANDGEAWGVSLAPPAAPKDCALMLL